METSIEDILKKNQLSVTDSRRKILYLFVQEPGAVSHGDIEKKLSEKFDRVTVYRTLQTFLDKGIIHSIPTADNTIQYALCKDDCSSGQHQDHHVHFVCRQCGNTLCLDDVSIPQLKLPEGYSATKVEVLVNGVCRQCQ